MKRREQCFGLGERFDTLDHAHTVDREPGESDERYQARCDLWAAVLDYAKRG